MYKFKKHIILIGFKSAGKTSVGKMLSEKINSDFFDLDDCIEKNYKSIYSLPLSCCEIFKKEGELFFREKENELLNLLLKKDSLVLSTGGGTPLTKSNQLLLSSEIVFHVTASKEKIFERIRYKDMPASFPEGSDRLEVFNTVWEARQPIYQAISHYTILNEDSVESAVEKIFQCLDQEQSL